MQPRRSSAAGPQPGRSHVRIGGFRSGENGYSGGVSSNALSEHLLDCLKRVAAALRDADVPYALGGGLSAWARGGPPSENDVDLLIREEDVDNAHRALEALGLRTEVPPEGWLVKA